MDELIRQVRLATNAGLYFVALLAVLTIPDICGALASPDGKASGSKYKQWIKDNVPTQSGNADLIYGLRCSLLHQGQTLPHGGTFPLAFIVATGGIHNISTVFPDQTIGWLILPIFVDEVTSGAEAWFNEYGSSNTVQKNLAKFAHLRLDGIHPHVVGAPVFA
jgi:hypothetical protein